MPFRILWIDNLKGFVLLMVILGHAKFPTVWPYMYGINQMQVFFFLSGLLFQDEVFLNEIAAYTTKKFKALLLPYLFFSITFLLISTPLYDSTIGYDSQNVFLRILHLPLVCDRFVTYLYITVIEIVNGSSSPSVGSAWFFYVLFFTLVFYFFIKGVASGIAKGCCRDSIILIMCTISFLHGWYMNLTDSGHAFKIGVILSAIPIMYIGDLSKKLINKIRSIRSIILFFCFAIAYSITHFLYIHGACPTFGVNMLGGSICPYIIETICGIVSLCTLFTLLDRIRIFDKISVFFQFLSRNAIIILPIHWFFRCWYVFLMRGEELNWWYLPLELVVMTLGTLLGLIIIKQYAWKYAGLKKRSLWYQ